MSFVAGSYVYPRKLYFAADQTLRDSSGRRSTYGRVVDPIPSAPSHFIASTFNPSTSTYDAVAVDALVFSVEVWDIDLQALTVDSYPETDLLAISTFGAAPFGQASAVHADADNLPPELTELAAAMRNS